MKDLKLGKAIAAGFGGTLLMTMMMMIGPSMGMPRMDIAAMLGSMFAGGSPPMGSGSWLVGFGMHLIIGIVLLPVGFALISNYLPTWNAVIKGLFFGVTVWLIAQLMVMPMMGAGLFSSNLPQGRMLAVGSLLGHLLYGGVVGFVYQRKGEEELGHFSTPGF